MSLPSAGAPSQPSTHKIVRGALNDRFDQAATYEPYAPALLQSILAKRLTLAAPLRQAFAPLEPRQGRGTHTP
jgi:hypothetical protein